MKEKAVAGMGMVLMAAMLWGTTGTAQTLAPAGLPAHWVGALRLLFSGIFFVGFVLVGRRAGPLRAQFAHVPWRWVLVAGAAMAAYNLTFFAGVKASSVAVGTAIALGSGPIWAGLLQIAATRRSPAGAWWLGTLLAVAGGSWMVIGSAQQLNITAWGVGLCLLSGLSYAAYTLISKRMVSDTPAPIVTLCVFLCAAAIAVPLALAVSGVPETSLRGWAVVVYLGVVATGVAYLLFTHALGRISGTTAVSMGLAEPLTAFVLAILVIGEHPPPAAFAGLALVMLGLALVVRSELRSAPR
jgi:DME family drug/metabolite transporter